MRSRTEVFDGRFDELDDMHQQVVKLAASYFHYRNGTQPDGSWGEIKINYDQLLNVLAFMLTTHP